MSARDAAIQVLKEAGVPLHKSDITKRILEKKLWTPKGKTPESTVEAQICSDMQKNGDASVFIRVAPRTFALKDSLTEIPTDQKPLPQAKKPKQGKTPKTYSFTESAEKVLDQFGNKQPMHYKDIAIKALESKWLTTEGKTPEASMYAQVITEIKRYQKRGEQPRFVMHGNGFVGLSKWMGRGLAFDIEQHNRKTRQELWKRLFQMDPKDFEELIGRLLAEIGFEEIQVTKHSGDGGIDVRGTLVVGDVIRTQMAVQVKRWKKGNNVQAPIVQQVRGSLGSHDQGLIITTSNFSQGARAEAELPDRKPVALMNGEQLVALLVENNIGITRLSHDIIELNEDL